MPHTSSFYQQDQPNTDGIATFGPEEIMAGFVPAAGTALITRNAAGSWSWNQAASVTNIYGIPLTPLMFRLGFSQDTQEQFGGSVGPIGVAGRPPFTGATQLVPPTTNKVPKGIKILDFVVNYIVITNPLTAMTCRYDRTVYAEGAAPAVTNILASAANGLLLTVTNGHSVKITGLAAQTFEITDLSQLIFELSIQTPAGGTCQLHNIQVHYAFNYN